MDQVIKPMVYHNPFIKPFPIGEILAQGTYKNHKYVVGNLGTHPCGYIENKLTNFKGCHWDMKTLDIDNELSDGRLSKVNSVVHGGITYVGKSKWDDSECDYIGWDYMHSGDYTPFRDSGIKYTTEDVLKDCFKAIDCLIEAEGDE